MNTPTDTHTSPIIEALYHNFLLRDVFAKIVPGFFVIAAFGLIWPTALPYFQTSGSIPWYMIIVAIGGSWLFGFAVQAFGEKLWILRHHPEAFNSDEQRYELRVKFAKVANLTQIKQVERYVVVKEATGNAAAALILFQVMVLIRIIEGLIWPDTGIRFEGLSFESVMMVAVCLPISLALMSSSWSHRDKQYKYMQVVHRLSSAENG
ncbi:MAG: hypothetical protein AAFR74_07675 [Pseudomonadota bacterium]